MKEKAPKQERSQRTLLKLLGATVRVLDEHGLEGATVPRIAERAGVAPASVYRRFDDKDALVREALVRVLDESVAVNQAAFSRLGLSEMGPEKAVRSVVRALLKQYGEHPRLLQAVRTLADRGDKEFLELATDRVAKNFRNMVSALTACGELKAREEQVTFALLTVASAMETMMLDPTSLWSVLWSGDDLEGEFTRMLLAYLGLTA